MEEKKTRISRRTPGGTTTYDLTIGEIGLNIGGRKTTAIDISGTVPGPLGCAFPLKDDGPKQQFFTGSATQ